MKKLTLLLAALFVLLCIPVFCHAQDDTTFFSDRYEILEMRFRVPFLSAPVPVSDTTYTVYLNAPVRIQIKNGVLIVPSLGRWPIENVDRKVRHYGSDGDEVWYIYKLKDNQFAMLTSGYFMMDVRPSKRLQTAYTFEVIGRRAREIR